MIVKILSQIPKLLLVLLLDAVGILILYPCLCVGSPQIVPLWLSWFDNYGKQYGNDINNRWRVYYWLSLRNPVNNFQYRVLGFKWGIVDQVITYIQNGVNSPTPEFSTELVISGKRYWEECHYYKWPYLDRYFRIRIGWKIGRIEENVNGEYVQWCFTITPFKSKEQI